MNIFPSNDLSTLVEQLFSQKLHIHQKILQQIQQEIQQRQKLHNQILENIDKQISKNRIRLREIESKNDFSIWLHPRRTQIESQLSEWHKQRLHHQVLAWEHLEKLKQKYISAWKECTEALQTSLILANTTPNHYSWHSSNEKKEKTIERKM
jgi:hypothetical protein